MYLHLGESYRVLDLDLEGRAALVESFAGDEYTQAKKDTMTAILETARTERRLGVELAFGTVTVTEQVVAYQRKRIQDGETIETVALDLRPSSRRRPSGSCPSPGCSRASRRCRGCWARSMRPSTP